MTVAGAVAPLVHAAVGRDAPVEIRGSDGSRTGPPNAQWAMKINNRRGLRRLLWAPNDLGFARAYVSGDIEIEGDLLAGMEVLEQMSAPARGLGVRIDAETKKALVKAALRLGIIGPPPKPPSEESKLARWQRHDKRRDAAAISHHYDVGNEFYRVVLGESMTCSFGYWATPDDGLAVAQYAKCDLVARKLGLTCGYSTSAVGGGRSLCTPPATTA
jgi:cyclopropane-fatty-acyl-phospholipid synthase